MSFASLTTYEAPSALLCGSRSLGCVCAVEENGYPLGIDSSVSLLVNASRGVLFATAAFPLLGFAVLSGVQCVAVALSVGVGASSLVVSRVHISRLRLFAGLQSVRRGVYTAACGCDAPASLSVDVSRVDACFAIARVPRWLSCFRFGVRAIQLRSASRV